MFSPCEMMLLSISYRVGFGLMFHLKCYVTTIVSCLPRVALLALSAWRTWETVKRSCIYGKILLQWVRNRWLTFRRSRQPINLRITRNELFTCVIMYICLSVCLWICLSVCLSVFLCICFSVYLPVIAVRPPLRHQDENSILWGLPLSYTYAPQNTDTHRECAATCRGHAIVPSLINTLAWLWYRPFGT